MTVEDAEQLIAEHFGRGFCVLAGSGSTAIYLLLRAVETDRRSVLMPSILCPAPLYAVLGAGFCPIFCDCAPDSYSLSSTDVEARVTPDTGVLFAPHLFGDPLPRDAMRRLADKHRLLLVEDAAQGGWWSPPVPGSVTVVSFGWQKPLSAGWGGAVLTDDDSLAVEVRRLRDGLKPSPPMRMRDCAFDVPPPAAWLRPVAGSQLHRIVQALHCWPEHAARRRGLSQLYASALQRDGLCLPADPSVPLWRFSVLLPDRSLRDRALVSLCRRGLSAWKMYPPLHIRWSSLLPNDSRRPLAAAEDVGRRILNLVIEPGMTGDDALTHAAALMDALKELMGK